MNKKVDAVQDSKRILKLLKQSFPFLMVDGITYIEPGQTIEAYKNVSANEPYFTGHFPDYPIMPGVYIIEALAQTASLLFNTGESAAVGDDEIMVLGVVNDMRLLSPVFPGDRLKLHVGVIKMTPCAALVEVSAQVEGRVAAKGKLSFAKVKKGMYGG